MSLKQTFYCKLIFLFVLFGIDIHAQIASSYMFSNSNTVSLSSMAGSTQLIGPSADDVASNVTNIGFTFGFMGSNYTQFSSNSNGTIRLGAVPISGNTTGQNFPISNQQLISPYLGDLATSNIGKVHYILSGSAPNRVLIIEWLNMQINYSSSSADGTFQVHLYECSGTIEFVYGEMKVSGITNRSNSHNVAIGFANNNTANNVFSVNQSTYAIDNTSATAIINSNSSTNTGITGLTSSADGSRRMFTFNPLPVATASNNNQSTCTASAFLPINLSTSNNIPSTTFSWTRDNGHLSTGNVIGIPSSGTGDILGTVLVNTTTAPVPVTFTITPQSSSGCEGIPTTAIVTVNPAPPTPGSISGLTSPCPGSTGNVYSIIPVPYATTYTWKVPAGWAISSGGTTNSIVVSTGGSGNNGNITVTASNACGTSPVSSLAVVVNPGTLPTPGSINGLTTQCPGSTGNVYSVASVPNATTYTWTVPTGWAISSGAATNSIVVSAGASGDNGNITVTAGNSCGTSAASSLAVIVSPGAPPTPSSISGLTIQCPGLTGNVYSVASVPDATTYTWTVPTGWAISSGGTTNAVVVSTGASGDNGTITVTAGNSCGTSAVSSLAVIVSPGAPSTPGSISGLTAQCPGLSGKVYSINSVPNATTYTWTVPTGWAISSGGTTNAVVVSTGASGNNGNITVTAGNSCGTSAVSSLAVIVNPNLQAGVSILATESIICEGMPVVFTAKPTNGGISPSYRWKNNGIDIVGAISSTYTSTELTDGNEVSVWMKSSGNLNCLTDSVANSNKLSIRVNPLPPEPYFTPPLTSVCPGTNYVYFTTNNVQANSSYFWSGTNANLLTWGGISSAIFNFENLTPAIITLKITNLTTGCNNIHSETIAVTGNSAPVSPPISVLSNNWLICQLSGSDINYQWGYDSLPGLSSKQIPGAVFQQYHAIDYPNPHKKYWVIIKENGCFTKSYVDGAFVSVDHVQRNQWIDIFPNPASNHVNVSSSEAIISFQIFDIFGRTVANHIINSQNSLNINIEGIETGEYLIGIETIQHFKIFRKLFIKVE